MLDEIAGVPARRAFSIFAALGRTAVLSLLLAACGGQTISTAGDGGACDPAGTYAITWTSNNSACGIGTSPTVTVDSSGFPSFVLPCPTDCPTTCTRVPVSAASCVAEENVDKSCSISGGETATATFTYTGDTATFSESLTVSSDGGSVNCTFTGTGTRQ